MPHTCGTICGFDAETIQQKNSACEQESGPKDLDFLIRWTHAV
jgi:hypothetical protein